MARILVVDDERKIRSQIAGLLEESGHGVDQAGDVATARSRLQHAVYDLLVTDVRLPDGTGIELLREARSQQSTIAIVMITAYGTVEDAVEAMRLGAFDYMQKPFQLEALLLVIEHALEVAILRAEHRYLLNEVRGSPGGPQLVGAAQVMQEVRRLLATAATQPTTVLLSGESGTGKELAAELIHDLSGKSQRPLVRVNCPALPAQLFESELFGHVRGAFTDARESRRGKFELAGGGTLLLDEISEIPLAQQAKLLRVLEERSFTRVGGDTEIHVELRVIAATNRDLQAAVDEGRFRADLYYRLNVFPVRLPALREHIEDLPELAQHLLQQIATQFHTAVCQLTPAALECLSHYSWPGNVRELRNVLERGALLARSNSIDVPQLPHLLVTPGEVAICNDQDERGVDMNTRVERYQRSLILCALTRHRWRKKNAAAELGISPRALSHYLAKYEISDPIDDT